MSGAAGQSSCHRTQAEKPPYSVPSMAEIAAVPWTGFKVASTFSGCGGSCLGYRMAGYKVVWANEFIPAAQGTYKANHPDSVLDTRDIRRIAPEEIMEAAGIVRGNLDILDGSPPCASFSTAGKREEGWGKVKNYSDTQQRVDDLFFEYGRILRGLQPKVFVAENVSGLVKGTAKGYFLEILKALKDCGYRVEARLLDAQWLGVPQMRQRVIFLGVRNDLGLGPAFPAPLPYRYTVRDAIPWIVRGKYGPDWATADRPSPTVSASLTYNPETSQQRLELVEAEADISRYAIGREWDRLKPGEQSGKYINLVKAHPDRPCNTVTAPAGICGAATVVHPTEKRRFSIAELKRICGFPDDFVLTGTFAQQWERLGRAVPPVMMAQIANAIRPILEATRHDVNRAD
jgi:DNA (cytosine-5)-methyltransferase 1